MTNFIKQVVARIQGDDAKVIAAKNERKAKAAFQQQIATLRAEEVEMENNVEEALEVYENALYPSTRIGDNVTYLSNIVNAKQRLDDAQADLEATKDSISFFEAEMKKAFTSK
jgi:outer membrane protein TolC